MESFQMKSKRHSFIYWITSAKTRLLSGQVVSLRMDTATHLQANTNQCSVQIEEVLKNVWQPLKMQ